MCVLRRTDQVDHLRPVANGGTHDPENLVPACGPCNMDRNASSVLTWFKRDKVTHALAKSENVRAMAYDALRAVARLLRATVGVWPLTCRTCGVRWPCPTARALHGQGLPPEEG
ncbi:HNH endonuclease [Streptomyces sp. RPT161]|uniref:HNH endonuclease n=1 Tax=Streptomyces sp. RPT161 TaxID=3015993 RepID=UPI003FCE00D5